MDLERVVSDILGSDSDCNWNASDEEVSMEVDTSFEPSDRLLMEQEGKMADRNDQYSFRCCCRRRKRS